MSSPGSLLAAETLALVRIASESGDESAIADHVMRLLRTSGPRFLRRHGNAIVAGVGSDNPPIVLGGHLDTVPENDHPDPAIAGDQVVGLGTSDMKGALAVMLALAKRPPSGSAFGLVFYDQEEVAYARNGLRPLFDSEPWLGEVKAAVLMEPTDNTLELGCLGALHAKATVRGVAAHSARPWLGENAIHRGATLIRRIAEQGVREHVDGPATYREVMNVTLAEGGVARNVIPDRFVLNVNFRFAPDRTSQDAERHIRTVLSGADEVEITDLAPAAPARADAPFFERFTRDQGITARAKQAWTDVAQFAAHGVPAANFGPGLPELAHKRDERIPIANLERCHAVMRAVLAANGAGA